MEKFLFNNNIHGYNKVTIDNFDASDKKDALVVVIVDKSCDKQVGAYYKAINTLLKNGNKLVLIGVDDENSIFRPLASLLITFSNYNIYLIPDKESLSAKELLKMEDREPDLAEVQTYIGGDVTAYTDMSTILFGIESLVDEGSSEKLKDFLEEHMLSIENLTVTLNNMKKTCDIFSSNELVDVINRLKEKETKLNKMLEEKDKAIEDVKYDRDKFKVSAEELKRENDKLKSKNSDLASAAESGVGIVKSYKEINTQMIDYKTKMILYFKEISYVPYTNSLITQLFAALEMRKLKVKLMIYDAQTNLYMTYKPLPVISGKEYISMKGTLIGRTKQFVVSEPNPTILQDVITSDQCFDVVIIYDRMKGTNDIVSGNNVSKFYVINSSKDYNEVKQILKINDSSFIITQAHSKIDKEKGANRQFLDIPFIDGYGTSTETAKTSKYIKLTTAFAKLPLIDTIIKKSRINTIANA